MAPLVSPALLGPLTITAATTGLLTVLQGLVGHGRGKFNIKAPAITGHIEFEKRYRAHANAIEGAIVFLPALWVFSLTVSSKWATYLGAAWLAARVVYTIGYLSEKPSARLFGFVPCFWAQTTLTLGALYGTLSAITANGLTIE